MFYTIRTITVLILLAALHLHIANRDKTLKDNVLGLMIVIPIIHFSAMLLIYFLAQDALYIAKAAPFGLFYGMLLFLRQQAETHGKLPKRVIFMHTMPVLPFWLFYLVFVFSNSVREILGSWYYVVGYSGAALSLFSYGTYLTFSSFKYRFKPSFLQFLYPFLPVASIFILLLAIETTGNKVGDAETRVAVSVALFMLLPAMFIFTETFIRFKQQFTSVQNGSMMKKEHRIQMIDRLDVKDNALSNKDFEPLQMFFLSDAIRDANLTLKSAAGQMGITQKMMTDMINEQYDTTFFKLLTIKRVELACRTLLSTDFDGSYDNLASSCGFGSSASFYRNFKQLLHCSPMEFKSKELS